MGEVAIPPEDRELIKAYARKKQSGQKPNARETAAYNRLKKQQDAATRWDHYRSIPKKDWVEMSGRQPKVINEQATRFALPLRGRTIDLPAVVRSLHDFFADNKHGLSRLLDHREEGGKDEAREKLTWEQYRRQRLKRLAEEGSYLPAELVHELLAELSTILRNAGELLAKHHGDDAQDILNTALDDFDALIVRRFDGNEGDGEE